MIAENQTTGEKIRKFRKRANISQLELECRINAATGSISKIEKGDTNPTKETLIKITEALDLNIYEVASLFNIKDNLVEILKISSRLYKTLDIDKILQQSVNDIVFELKLLGASIYILANDEDTLYSGPFTQSWFTKALLILLGPDMGKYKLSLTRNPTSLLVKCVKEQKTFYSLWARDFVSPGIPVRLTNLLQKLSKGKCGIAFPIIFNNKSLGCILFSKMYVDDFSDEYELLEVYTSHVATALAMAQNIKIKK